MPETLPPPLAPEDARRLLAGELPLEPLTPEAGSRRYFRSLDPRVQGWLLVRSPDPPPRATAVWLREAGVRVPALGPEAPGAWLTEDCGDRLLCRAPEAAAWEEVLALRRRWAARPLPGEHPNARLALDEPLFRRELRRFREDWLQAFRRRAWSPVEADRVDALCRRLAREAARGPFEVQHRDLHSRNLLRWDGSLVVLDHQDLRPGPVHYDLASLATDAYVDLPPGVAARLEEEAVRAGAAAGWEAVRSLEQFRIVALQRVLKALGTFGRLLVQGRQDYRRPEERARRRARELLDRLPAWEGFADWLA